MLTRISSALPPPSAIEPNAIPAAIATSTTSASEKPSENRIDRKNSAGELIPLALPGDKTSLLRSLFERSAPLHKIGFNDLPEELLLDITTRAAVRPNGSADTGTLRAMRATSHLMKRFATIMGNGLPLRSYNSNEHAIQSPEFVLPKKHKFNPFERVKKTLVRDNHSISPHTDTYAMVKSYPGMTDYSLRNCVDADLRILPKSLKKLDIDWSEGITPAEWLHLSDRLENLTSLSITNTFVEEEVALAFARKPNIQYLNFAKRNNGWSSIHQISPQVQDQLKQIAEQTGKTIIS